MDKEELYEKYLVPDHIDIIGIYWIRLKKTWKQNYALVRCKYKEDENIKDGILIFNRRD